MRIFNPYQLGKYCDITYSHKYRYYIAYDNWNRELVKIESIKTKENSLQKFSLSKLLDYYVDDYGFNRILQTDPEGEFQNCFNPND